MTDAILESAKYVLNDCLNEMDKGLHGLPAEALNWKPGGEDSNTITVLVTHALHSTRSWLCVAVGGPLPQRDRDSEFRVRAGDPRELSRFLKDFAQQCRDILTNAADVESDQIEIARQRFGGRVRTAIDSLATVDAQIADRLAAAYSDSE